MMHSDQDGFFSSRKEAFLKTIMASQLIRLAVYWLYDYRTSKRGSS